MTARSGTQEPSREAALRAARRHLACLAVAASLAAACAPTTAKDAASPTPQAQAKAKPASVTCPAWSSPSGVVDAAALFGLDAGLAARVERIVRLTGELERAASSLDDQTRAACTAIARDVDPAPLAPAAHPCAAAQERLAAFAKRLPAGATLDVSVRGVSCAVPRDALERCAGECLTGKQGVTSAVSCGAGPAGASCTVDAAFPNASASCAAQCGARALTLGACSADVDVRVSSGGEDLAPTLDALRRDLPKVVALGAEIAPRAARAAKTAASLVDEVAAAIDAITSSGDKAERRVVVAAVLASCVAPELAKTVRAGASLEASVARATELHAAVVRR